MRTFIIKFILLLITTIIFISCGTTHHFVPPRPLENNEYLISVTWYYDFDKGHFPAIVPDLNFYKSIDNRLIAGFGYQMPYYISHVTAAKYFDSGDNANWNIFTHFNQPFGFNNNPYFELGGTYSTQGNYMWHSTSAGIAYGNGAITPAGLFSLKETKDAYNNGSQNQFMPFLKLQLGGQDIAVSYNHYFGLTKSIFTKTLQYANQINDTILVIPTNIIDSVKIIDSMYIKYMKHVDFGIFLNTGDTIIIANSDKMMRYGCIDPMGYYSYINFNELEQIYKSFSSKKYFIYAPVKYMKSKENVCMINPNSFLESWNKNENVVLEYYPSDINDLINEYLKSMNDYSIGISIQNYNK